MFIFKGANLRFFFGFLAVSRKKNSELSRLIVFRSRCLPRQRSQTTSASEEIILFLARIRRLGVLCVILAFGYVVRKKKEGEILFGGRWSGWCHRRSADAKQKLKFPLQDIKNNFVIF